MKKDFFKNKRVLVMGFGLHGWGVGAVNWLFKHEAKVTVTDLKSAAELAPMLKKISRRKVKLVLGRHRAADFQNADILLQNPGVRRESKYLKITAKAGGVIENDASIFVKNCLGTVIGVTGTRGKSTTTALIYEMLKESRIKNQESRIYIAGLPQMPLLGVLDKVKAEDIAVLELSSWQLEILGAQKISPPAAVVTNIYPDHLNRYRGMADYVAAKTNIFRFQDRTGITVLNRDNRGTLKLGRSVPERRYWFSKKYFPAENGCFVKNRQIYFRHNGVVKPVAAISRIRLAGEHNLENILGAVCLAKIFGAANKGIVAVLRSFNGLPSRIELIREIKGVKYINDTTATTPDGTIAALKSLKQKNKKTKKSASAFQLRSEGRRRGRQKNIILIAGGDFKNIPDAKYRELAELIKKTCKAVVLFKGGGSRQILKFLKISKLVAKIDKMSDAVGLARSFAEKGDIVLLSPACASFNLFINEYDRGEQFNRIVRRLK